MRVSSYVQCALSFGLLYIMNERALLLWQFHFIPNLFIVHIVYSIACMYFIYVMWVLLQYLNTLETPTI